MGTVRFLRRSLIVAAMAAAVLVAASVSGAAKVSPILLSGASDQGKNCSDNQGSGQTWTQLKVDPPNAGTYTDGTLTVTVSYESDNVFDWTSNIGVDGVLRTR